MKFARRLSLFLTSRWMRRLVWLPCLLFGCIVLGATLESNGFRLSYISKSNHQLPSTWKAAGYGSSAQPGPYAGNVINAPPQPHTTFSSQRTNPQSTTILQTYPAQPPQAGYLQQQYGANQAAYQAPQPAGSQYGFRESPQPNRPAGQYSYNGFPNVVQNAPNAPVPATYHQATSQGEIPSFQSPGYSQNSPSVPGFNGSTTVSSAPLTNNASSQSDLQESSKLTHLANEAQRIGSSDPVQLEATLRQLHALAIHQFQTKQNNELAELKKAKDALSNWEAAISERESLMKPIVESHLAQLLKSPDKLNWSFSGSQLLNSQTKQSNQANYQEILSKLWASQPKQQSELTPSEPTSQETLELPSPPMPSVIDVDSDSLKRPSLNGLQPLTNKIIEPPLPVADPSAETNDDPDSLEKPTLGDKGTSSIP